MKKSFVFMMLLLVFFSFKEKSMAQIYDDKPSVISFEQIEKLFKTPPVAFRSAPLWVWNDTMTKE